MHALTQGGQCALSEQSYVFVHIKNAVGVPQLRTGSSALEAAMHKAPSLLGLLGLLGLKSHALLCRSQRLLLRPSASGPGAHAWHSPTLSTAAATAS